MISGLSFFLVNDWKRELSDNATRMYFHVPTHLELQEISNLKKSDMMGE